MIRIPVRRLYPWAEKDPLIDVIENKGVVRVIVVLPSIRREDLWLDVKDGILVVEVTKYGKVYRKETPCNIIKNHVFVRSVIIHNAVLEAILVNV